MKTRLVVLLVALAISFAVPTYAQQKDLADPQTTQKILANVKAFDEAVNNLDAAAIAAHYTRDAVYVTLPRTVCYASTRVLHQNRPQRRLQPPALARLSLLDT